MKNKTPKGIFVVDNKEATTKAIERIKKMEGMEKAGFIFNKDKCVNITHFDII